ncbi:MAG: hypothetical protein J0L70_04805 [Leptolyngbya sp. UWPOB_LEPTO1]|uniref:hypothetical protein n=1 Tax=Leptolyngbya sp. UWPOB_LEPTO1 TaxID=2815653 RepID=UPI001ACD1161|nr:hypothetical protein [Leptolyngbya sp. UWPOB_LEPTO1]MBN8559820.1 hypothetical protein [Leptolyngbya sp. UWPOB_LEPTO1]
MQINDLNYLEHVLDVKTISGGVIVGVTADASATGDSSFTLTDTRTKVKELGNGGSIGKGSGIAVATGTDSLAGVDLFGSGDKVIEKTKVKYFSNKDTMIVKGKILVIDKP